MVISLGTKAVVVMGGEVGGGSLYMKTKLF